MADDDHQEHLLMAMAAEDAGSTALTDDNIDLRESWRKQ